MRFSSKTVVLTGACIISAVLPVAASGYEVTPLPTALKQHDVVLVAKVVRRTDGKVSLAPERIMKGRLDRESFELPQTWNAESKFWTPLTLLGQKRYLLMLNRDDKGRLIYSKDPLSESVVEVATIDDTQVRTAAAVLRLLDAPDAVARTRALDEAWTEESDKVKEQLLSVLLQLGPDEATVPYLVRCMEAGAERSSLMEVASLAIGRFEYRQTAPALLKALKKDDWACIYPAQALARLKVRDAYQPLMDLIASPRAQNRVYFIEALCELDDERAIPFLIQTAGRNLRGIDPAFGTYGSFDVRENQFAVACLGRLRARQATEVLEKIAQQSDHKELQKLAQHALAAIRSSQ